MAGIVFVALPLAAGAARAAENPAAASNEPPAVASPEAAVLTVPPSPSPAATAAVIAGTPVTVRELDAQGALELIKLRSQEYELRLGILEDLIVRRLLEREARARGMTVEALSLAEIDGKVAPVTDEEVRAAYEKNKARYTDGLDAAAPALRNLLRQQKVFQRRDAYLDTLKKKAGVEILLDAPRLPVEAGDAPSRGPATAPVTLVVFADYECPFCAQLAPTLQRLAARYGERLRIAYREFPLGRHGFAMEASEAGLCAREQGKFWEMHERLYAEQDRLKPEDLREHARALGLDTARFGACLESDKFRSEIRQDMDSGRRWGVVSTPTLFVNGRPVVGAKPFEAFVQVIDEELERSAARKPGPEFRSTMKGKEGL